MLYNYHYKSQKDLRPHQQLQVMLFIEFIISFLLGVVIYILKLFLEDDDPKPIPIKDLMIPKSELVGMVVRWSHENLGYPDTHYPIPTTSYTKHKKHIGLCRSHKHEVVVYVNNHPMIQDLINTIIHEYIHARQRDKSFGENYDRYNEAVGYDNNTYEIECRDISNQNTNRCLFELQQNHHLTR